MADKWAVRGAATLHGCMTSSFPNLFLAGNIQTALGPNFTGGMSAVAHHAAHIIGESLRRAAAAEQQDDNDNDNDNAGKRLAIEPTVEAEEAWVAEILKYDMFGSPMAVCTPGYFNNEGEGVRAVSGEEGLKRRRNGPYMRGVPAYRKVLSDWEADGKLEGLTLRW